MSTTDYNERRRLRYATDPAFHEKELKRHRDARQLTLAEHRKKEREYKKRKYHNDENFREKQLLAVTQWRKEHREWIRENGCKRSRKLRGVADPHGDIKVGACDFPGCDFNGRLELDHCHKTGRHRGWLCKYHNVKIGWLEKLLDMMWIEKVSPTALAYLSRVSSA